MKMDQLMIVVLSLLIISLFFVFCLFFVCCWFWLHMVGWFVCYVTLLESHKKTQEKINQAINWSHMCNKQTHEFWTNKAHQAWVIVCSPSILIPNRGTTTNSKKQRDVHLWRSWKSKQAIIKTFGKHCCCDFSLLSTTTTTTMERDVERQRNKQQQIQVSIFNQCCASNKSY